MIAVLTCLAALGGAPQEESPRELRGVWISADDRDLLASPAKIGAAMQAIAEAGANAVFVPAWTGGTTTFPCAALRDAFGLERPERDVLAELLLEAHRNGLEAFPWLEPGIRCPSEGECEAAKKRPEVFARDESGKVRVVNGVAPIDLAAKPGEDLALAVVVEMCTNYDLDGVVGPAALERMRKEVVAVDPNLVVIAPRGLGPEPTPAAPVLPEIDREGAEKTGDRIVGYVRLREKDDELSYAIRDEAWRIPALLPWRSDKKPWRDPVEALDPVAGGGNWSWSVPEGEPSLLSLPGGESGHVTWRFKPRSVGVYALYVWIPPRDDLTSLASFRLASASGSRSMNLDTSKKQFQGWIRLGEARLSAGQEIELARLTAEEKDATKVTAAGPIVPLLDRRAMRR